MKNPPNPDHSDNVIDIRAGRKPERCPECGSTRVVPIMYGLPEGEYLQKMKDADAIPGGCVIIRGESPAWGCRDCHAEFGKVRL